MAEISYVKAEVAKSSKSELLNMILSSLGKGEVERLYNSVAK